MPNCAAPKTATFGKRWDGAPPQPRHLHRPVAHLLKERLPPLQVEEGPLDRASGLQPCQARAATVRDELFEVGLQPCEVSAATVCGERCNRVRWGCNRAWWGLQPCEVKAATVRGGWWGLQTCEGEGCDHVRWGQQPCEVSAATVRGERCNRVR